MILNTPAPYHLELFRYWRAIKGFRAMPTRSDLDPGEITRLLPHIALVDTEEGCFRWRLMGTAVAAELGCDLTRQKFGMYAGPLSFATEMSNVFSHVLATGDCVLQESEYDTAEAGWHAVSRLLLPLAAGDNAPPMVLCLRIARGRRQARLALSTGRVTGSFQISSARDLMARTTIWEKRQAQRRHFHCSVVHAHVPHIMMQGGGFDRAPALSA